VLVHWTANINASQLVEGRFTKQVNAPNSAVTPLIYTKTSRTLLLSDEQGATRNDQGGTELTACAYHVRTHLLASGYAHGALLLHDLHDVQQPAPVHSISCGDQPVRTLAFNGQGDWLALATGGAQLIVWEWQSETYVMRQQSHVQPPTCVAYSPDAQTIASGGSDGRVKVWCCRSSLCLVTFAEHTAAVTDVCWTQGGRAILSASLDGTVRACDMLRWAHPRTSTI
jgi:periodic tryptophan protein 2